MTTPAHKHVGDEGAPGQIVNPINHDMMEDMGQYSDPGLTRRGNPVTQTVEPAKRTTWNDLQIMQQIVLKEHLKMFNHHAQCLRDAGVDPAKLV